MKQLTPMLMGVLFPIFGIVSLAQAQVEKAEIRVHGLSCPFCAYGLEKKLKKIEGVGKVEINVDKAVAMLESKQGHSIEVEEIEPAVKNAGFTLEQLTVTVVGTINQAEGTPVLMVSAANQQFMLQDNEQLRILLDNLEGPKKRVRINGKIRSETPARHHAHPYTLFIETFEIH